MKVDGRGRGITPKSMFQLASNFSKHVVEAFASFSRHKIDFVTLSDVGSEIFGLGEYIG